ncbi:thioredoxin-like domain-containing protein [Verrucomicrobiales bacterium BCK34]|nr:thioredoxin-like domain-containing protein [Verrucomicrobiales bacterium BCK34]
MTIRFSNYLSRSLLAVCGALGLALVSAEAKDEEPLRIEFLDTKGGEVSFETLKGKTLGFYFSAHWCPPCRQFTPTLVNFRNENKENFEVIFVSFDNSNTEKENYMREAEMPWLTLPGFKNREANALAQMFGVKGYPTLVIIDADGKLITPNGRADVMLSPDTAIEKWQAAAAGTSAENPDQES